MAFVRSIRLSIDWMIDYDANVLRILCSLRGTFRLSETKIHKWRNSNCRWTMMPVFSGIEGGIIMYTKNTRM